MENEKRCPKCKTAKSLDMFHQDRHTKDGLCCWCKECQKTTRDLYANSNPEKVKELNARFRERNREKLRERSRCYEQTHREERREQHNRWAAMNPEKKKEATRRWVAAHPEKVHITRQRARKKAVSTPEGRLKANKAIARWAEKHQDRVREKNRLWVKANPQKVRQYYRKHGMKECSTDRGKLNSSMSCSIYRAIKGEKKGRRWEDLVGFTVDQLKRHIEKQFKSGMSWDNFGEWHVDHKIPVVAFNFERPEDIDFKRCWDLRNLQPLWAEENRKKHTKIDRPFQPSLMI